MKVIPEFDTAPLTEAQRTRMQEYLVAARRAVSLSRPQEYRQIMGEAFRYFVTHHPEMSPTPGELTGMVELFLASLPRIRGRNRKRLSALEMLLLLILGLGGAYTFLYLYFNRGRLKISEGLVFGGLVLLSLLLMALPLFFNRRSRE